MTIQIRRYTLSDTEAILSLVERFSEFELPEWQLKEDLDLANRAFLEQAIGQPEPGSAIFIAEEDGVFAGFIHLQTKTDYFTGERHGYISDLAVAREFEGRGIGRMLLETAGEWTLANGYRLLALYVFAGNARARQIYEKNGFDQEVIKYVKVIE